MIPNIDRTWETENPDRLQTKMPRILSSYAAEICINPVTEIFPAGDHHSMHAAIVCMYSVTTARSSNQFANNMFTMHRSTGLKSNAMQGYVLLIMRGSYACSIVCTVLYILRTRIKTGINYFHQYEILCHS
jgi:hypothetical protein